MLHFIGNRDHREACNWNAHCDLISHEDKFLTNGCVNKSHVIGGYVSLFYFIDL